MIFINCFITFLRILYTKIRKLVYLSAINTELFKDMNVYLTAQAALLVNGKAGQWQGTVNRSMVLDVVSEASISFKLKRFIPESLRCSLV